MGLGNSSGKKRQSGSSSDQNKDKKLNPPPPHSPVPRNQQKPKANEAVGPLPTVTPLINCLLRLVKLERILDYLKLEESFIDCQKKFLNLQEEEIDDAQLEVELLRGCPMLVGDLEEICDENHAIVSISGEPLYVGICSFVDKDKLQPKCEVLMSKYWFIVGVLEDEVDPAVAAMIVTQAPQESYTDIGGLETQIQEIKEVIELPLTHPELYEEIGIRPSNGVLLYGEPGTGKTLLAKAVANSTSATFLRLVGSELVTEDSGMGSKLVRGIFKVANDLSPSIVFIDDIDTVGTKRDKGNSSGSREIQRTMLELLNQLDGFDSSGNVRVILATNRIQSLDPALVRTGRIDRKIQFPLPDIPTRRHIFQIHTSRMALADDVNLEEFIRTKSELSGADIKAICRDAALLALRERRLKVTHADFKVAKEKMIFRKNDGVPEGLYM